MKKKPKHKHAERYWAVLVTRDGIVKFSRWGGGGSVAALCQKEKTAILRAKKMPDEWKPVAVEVIVKEV